MPPITEIIAKYTALRDGFERFGALVDPARLCGEFLRDLHDLQVGAGEELLPLREAALQSGYSPEHLRRLVRDGRLPRHGKGRRLLFRSADLPRKAAAVDRSSAGAYDPIADARAILGDRARRNRGP